MRRLACAAHFSSRLVPQWLEKQARRLFLRFDPFLAASHVRCRCWCGVGGVPFLINSILRNRSGKTTLSTRAALSCIFAGSTSDRWPRANSISNQGSPNGVEQAVASSACQSLFLVHMSLGHQFTHAPLSLRHPTNKPCGSV